MGETQGSMWTTGLFIILFTGMVTVLLWGLDIMHYNSTMYAVEDNIKAGNYDYIKTLSDDYIPCGPAYDTTTNCSAIIEINTNDSYVKYQLAYNGTMLKKDASGTEDKIVLMPY